MALVDGNRDLGHGVQIIAAPGETPGHQIVRIHSEGETFYCLGDLYHHPVEFLHPERMVSWTESESEFASRKALKKPALTENAFVVATHIPGIGRLKRKDSDVIWESV